MLAIMSRRRLIRWGAGGLVGATMAVTIPELTKGEEEIPAPPLPNNSLKKDAAEVGAVGILSGLGLTKIAGGLMCGIGFTEAGVAAKSIAAWYQAQLGNVVAGSAFAKMQAVGAKGGLALFGPVGLGAAVICGGAFAVYKIKRFQREQEEMRRREEEEKNKQLCNRFKNLFFR